MMQIEVCHSPLSYPLFHRDESIVVVVDVLRATSAICTAFYHGIENIIPVTEVGEAMVYQQQGYIVAAERKGEIVDGFTLGNSPFGFMKPELKGKKVVLTTTNGTQAIAAAKNAYQLLIGSFLNLQTLGEYLIVQNRNVIVLCAGWKDKFNLEDTLFAGALANYIQQRHEVEILCDSAIGAQHLWQLAKNDINEFLENSSHRKRLSHLGLEEDIQYCLSLNLAPIIPVYNKEKSWLEAMKS